VLSETPAAWKDAVLLWRQMNRRWQEDWDGQPIPDPNEEYLLYQTLVATWPLEPMDDLSREEYVRRIAEYMEKALREAKLHTSWMNPSEDYEAAALGFVRTILGSEAAAFQTDLAQFVAGIADAGFVNGLAQALMKIALPGVPDFYQGSEFWDFSLVDPDNRRPVDFASRQAARDELERRWREDAEGLASDVAAAWPDGRAKLLTTMRALEVRRRWPEVFERGQYAPLTVAGQSAEHVFAFARSGGARHAVCATPLRCRQLFQRSAGAGTPVGGAPRADWNDTRVELPAGAGRAWRCELSGRILEAHADGDTLNLPASELFDVFPVALVTSADSS
jgi:(1->4)-alpha-D-glucan 1-alpha-D-glucosylmutase